MKKSRSSIEQMVLFVALTYLGLFFFQRLWGGNQKTGNGPTRAVPTLVQAFAGIAPGSGTPLSGPQAATELAKLQAAIKTNGSDDYSYWARLRAGLMQQYGLGGKPDLPAAFKSYDEVVNHGAADAIDAQAIFQKGDGQWREASANGKPQGAALQDAAQTLERLIHRGRGSSQFLQTEIFVPADAQKNTEAPAALSLRAAQLPPAFVPVKVGNLTNVRERVNAYYATTTFYKIFDGMVRLLGNNPKFSYGMAVILFALFTRSLLQPLTRKQYDSMKGMQIIAPEMKKLQDRYKGKTDQASQVKMMAEMREIQKRHGVNPYLGCGLIVPQAMFFIFIVSPFIQHYEAKMELAGASLGWIHSLAQPDMALLLLYALSQFLSIRLSATPPTDAQQRQMQMFSTFMPFIFAFFLLQWPSAFTLYWMTFNLLATAFQWRMMKAADPDKNFWKTLSASPFAMAEGATADAPTDAVPPRPKPTSPRPAVKTINPAAQNGSSNGRAAKNGALNGADNAFENTDTDAFDGTSEASSDDKAARNGAGTQRSRRRRRH